MPVVELPLNNNSQFASKYNGYRTLFANNKTTWERGDSKILGEIKGQILNSNTIQFSPCLESDASYFDYYASTNMFIPRKWAKSSLYQQRDSDLKNIFNFRGNFMTNTLNIVFQGGGYKINAFIIAFDSGYNVIGTTTSPVDTIGNFNLSLDTTQMSNVAHVQWGFQMEGHPVSTLDTNQPGSVLISDFVTTTSTVQLPLNNNATFATNYKGFITVFQRNKTSYVYGDPQNVANLKGQLMNDNTIQYSPFALYDSSSFWFILENGKKVPQKWITSSLYQQKSNDLLNNFKFQGNFNTNTLNTSYGDNYTVSAFITVFNGSFGTLATNQSPVNTLGNFDLSLDATQIPNVAHVQWGFKMDGYVVHGSEVNNAGSVVISDVIVVNDDPTTVCQMS